MIEKIKDDAKVFVLSIKKEYVLFVSFLISAVLASLVFLVPAAIASAVTCPDLQYNSRKGYTDAQVAGEISKLQQFLSQFDDIYPSRIVNGVFGDDTDLAVKAWQLHYHISNSSRSDYGIVGPKTRKSIKEYCNSSADPNSNLVKQIELEDLDTNNPLKRVIKFSLKSSNCSAYVIDWGDDSAPTVHNAYASANCKDDTMNITSSHTYATGGNYVIKLNSGYGDVNNLPLVDGVQIVVNGDDDGSGARRARMTVAPSNGKIPLTVTATVHAESALLCTAYNISWGDDSPDETYDPGNYTSGCYGGKFARNFTHTYTEPGTYTVNVKAGPASLDNLRVMSVSVTAYDTDWMGDDDEDSEEPCFVNPRKGNVPFSTAAFVPLGGDKCDGQYRYLVDWGDGLKSEQRYCSKQDNHYDVFFHQYATSGDFTAKLIQLHPNMIIPIEMCNVSVNKVPVVKITKPVGGDRVVIGKTFKIEFEAENVPGKKNGVDPTLRLTFLTEDGQAGFIADVDPSVKEYSWTPTSEQCVTGVCQSSIVPGKYKLQASLIYDPCEGDPYCGRKVGVIAVDKVDDPFEVFAEGEPAIGRSWMVKVTDRLFAHPLVSTAPSIVYFTTVLNSNASCLGGVYTIEYGDGTSSAQSYKKGTCRAFASSFTHTYNTPGLYTVQLLRNGIKVAHLNIKITAYSDNTAAVFDAIKRIIRELFNNS